MPIKNLNFFSNPWLIWGFIATLATGVPLLNAWFGFPLPATIDGLYSAIGGVIPYSDANGYIMGANYFNDVGYLDSWNMRRPLNALFYAFRLKAANGNFWYAMAIQAGLCAIALTLYLRTLRHDIGFIATSISLVFIYGYLQMFVHTTLSETLGLTLGLLAFVLLWNGYLQKDRLVFNVGMASLAVALAARAGPNFMVLALFLLVYLDPFTPSRLKDILLSILSFTIPFVFITNLSTLFGDPAASGMAFSNFGCVLYGLVSGGKTWAYAYQVPHIQSLISGKSEAHVAKIFYEESWNAFKANPFNLFIGLAIYFAGFFYFFLKLFSFGTGIINVLTKTISGILWIYIGSRIYAKRHSFKREFLFLTLVFLGIAASASITWKDGGIRPFAVAIPFMGALFGFSCASLPTLIKRKVPETILSMSIVAFIVLSSVLSPFILPRIKVPDISALKADQIPNQEIFLAYNLNNQPHLFLNNSLGYHFKTFSLSKIKKISDVFNDSSFGGELRGISQLKNNNLVLLSIYDYISHSTKIVLAEDHILNLDSGWIQIRADLVSQDFKTIYKASSYTGIPSQ